MLVFSRDGIYEEDVKVSQSNAKRYGLLQAVSIRLQQVVIVGWFYWGFTPFSTLVQVISRRQFDYSWSLGKQTSTRKCALPKDTLPWLSRRDWGSNSGRPVPNPRRYTLSHSGFLQQVLKADCCICVQCEKGFNQTGCWVTTRQSFIHHFFW